MRSSTVITDWHLWFAWYPVYVEGKMTWAENVYRKASWPDPILYGFDWKYSFENPIQPLTEKDIL